MKEPGLVADCISEMKSKTRLPITIKTRIGYDDIEDYENFIDLSQHYEMRVLKHSLFTQGKLC